MKKNIFISATLVLLLMAIIINCTGKPDPQLQEKIANLIGKLDTRNWNKASAELIKIGQPAVDTLIATMRNPDAGRWASGRAAVTLGSIKSEKAFQALITAVKDKNLHINVRQAAIAGLGNSGDTRAVGPILECLADIPFPHNRTAVRSLGKLKSERAVGLLISLLTNPSLWLRGDVAWSLGEIRSPIATGHLVKLLYETQNNVRDEAANALVKIGEPAVSPLLNTTTDSSSDIRMRSVSILGRIGSDKAIQPLISALRDPDWMVRDEAAVKLTGFDPDKTTKPLIDLLQDDTGYVREQAAWVLGELKADKAAEALITAMADPASGWMAAVALGKIQSPEALPPLMEALNNKNPKTRQAAVWALERTGSPEALNAVREYNNRHK